MFSRLEMSELGSSCVVASGEIGKFYTREDDFYILPSSEIITFNNSSDIS
jgi:hypothetical protein